MDPRSNDRRAALPSPVPDEGLLDAVPFDNGDPFGPLSELDQELLARMQEADSAEPASPPPSPPSPGGQNYPVSPTEVVKTKIEGVLPDTETDYLTLQARHACVDVYMTPGSLIVGAVMVPRVSIYGIIGSSRVRLATGTLQNTSIVTPLYVKNGPKKIASLRGAMAEQFVISAWMASGAGSGGSANSGIQRTALVAVGYDYSPSGDDSPSPSILELPVGVLAGPVGASFNGTTTANNMMLPCEILSVTITNPYASAVQFQVYDAIDTPPAFALLGNLLNDSVIQPGQTVAWSPPKPYRTQAGIVAGLSSTARFMTPIPTVVASAASCLFAYR